MGNSDDSDIAEVAIRTPESFHFKTAFLQFSLFGGGGMKL